MEKQTLQDYIKTLSSDDLRHGVSYTNQSGIDGFLTTEPELWIDFNIDHTKPRICRLTAHPSGVFFIGQIYSFDELKENLKAYDGEDSLIIYHSNTEYYNNNFEINSFYWYYDKLTNEISYKPKDDYFEYDSSFQMIFPCFIGSWVYVDNSDDTPFHIPFARLFKNIKTPISPDELFDNFEQQIHDLIPNRYSKDLPLYVGTKPRIDFNGKGKWFSIIDVRISIVPRFCTKEFIKENFDEIMEFIIAQVTSRPRFKKAGVPINYFKIGSVTITRDCTLVVVFQLKIETEDDIFGF